VLAKGGHGKRRIDPREVRETDWLPDRPDAGPETT
jgi:hypothetical protein